MSLATDTETQKLVNKIKAGYPASALINVLLQHYALDFPKFNRNVAISGALWGKWNTLYESILERMDKVAKAESGSEWDSFVEYTNAIGPLEEHMLDLKAHLDANANPALPKEPAGVSVLIVFLNQWFENRKAFVGTVGGLEESHFKILNPSPADAELLAAIRKDDETVLRDVVNCIQDHALQDDSINDRTDTDKHISDLKSKVSGISAKAATLAEADHDRMGKLVFALIGLYIPFLAHDHDTENPHFLSKELWTAVLAFADEAEKFCQDADISIPDFDKSWEEYAKVLVKEADAFAVQMITLMRKAGMVRRPFFGRTVGVVRMWQALTQSSNLRLEKRNSQRLAIQKLLAKTSEEFDRTRDSIKSFTDTQELQNAIEERKAVFDSLLADMEKEVKTYAAEKWSDLHDAYQKDATVDDGHLKKLYRFTEVNQQVATINATLLD